MLDTLSKDTLTNDILNAIVLRTFAVVRQLTDASEFEGENFLWNMNDDQPTMSIEVNNKPVYLYWNKEYEADKIEVYSNLTVTAAENLAWFMYLENLVFNELDELKKLIPAKPIELDDYEEMIGEATND